MQGQLMLRRAEPKDARTLFELRYLAYLRPYALYSSPENPCLEAFDGFAARVADQGQSQMYGLYLGTKPVGGAALCVRDGQVVLQELYVDPAMQGRGIGGQALRLLEARHPAAVYALEAPDDQGGGLFYQAGYRPTRQARQAGGRCQMFAWVKEAYKQVEILLSPLRREQLPALEMMCADLDARRLYDFGGGALEQRPGVEALSHLLGAGKHHAGASRLDYAIEVPQYGAVIGLISLTELEWEAESGEFSCVIIGAGINVSQDEADFGPEVAPIAISLAQALGTAPDRTELAAQVIRSLNALYDDFPAQNAAYLDHFRRDCLTVGNPIKVISGAGERIGTATGISDDFGLTVRWEDGSTETLTSGEVSVRGLYDYV